MPGDDQPGVEPPPPTGAEARALLRLGRTVHPNGELPLQGDPAVWRAVAALPPRQQAAVALFYLEDRPVKEIAEILGISVSTATSSLHQARQRLARDLAGGTENERTDRR